MKLEISNDKNALISRYESGHGFIIPKDSICGISCNKDSMTVTTTLSGDYKVTNNQENRSTILEFIGFEECLLKGFLVDPSTI